VSSGGGPAAGADGPGVVRSGPGARAHPVSYSEAAMTQLMIPQWVNLHGTVHGGYILMLADQIAYVVGSRHAGRPTVTASFDEVDFRSPINVGDIVTLHARVNYVGRTSMEIGVRVEAEDLLTRRVRHTNSCYITMVAVDDEGRPAPVPELLLETEEERARHERARERRRVREERRRRALGERPGAPLAPPVSGGAAPAAGSVAGGSLARGGTGGAPPRPR
jgi:acyl-CoA hydrolase